MTVEPSRISVLVVDDEEGERDLNKTLLEAAGYCADTAANLREARQLLAERTYAILLVDLRLPDGNGLDLLDDAGARDSHSVAVVLTGYTSVDAAVAAIKAGAYDLLTKPCPEERIVAAVHRAAERYELSRALSERTRELAAMNESLDRRVKEATEEIFELNERLTHSIKELQETNSGQTRFLEDMAHELKNPLSVVVGYSSFLLRKPADSWTAEEFERSLSSVKRNAQHVQELIDELLDSTRLAGSKIILNRKAIPLAKTVLEALDTFRFKAEEKEVRLDSELPQSNKATVFADPLRLKQVLINLLSNAVKFTQTGGSVTLRVKREEGRTHFCVSDTGPGMSEEDCARIFDRFYQAGSKEQQNGLGLGLNIVHGLVKLHGGHIWVESEIGRGSDFHFTIPDQNVSQTDDPQPRTFASPN